MVEIQAGDVGLKAYTIGRVGEDTSDGGPWMLAYMNVMHAQVSRGASIEHYFRGRCLTR